ncbi:DeoR/GlpR family DNA-binding transcription regulator [Schleiferilactobacillus perolens]|uniref:HTH-type transcriptional regulator FruR n=1 Tax=Schleiferilactobacillus perolens DSM 12744 TaxID=1423792 RepID=A0A0R1N494_9LACO|nr:DeoR/GlpR family DNA-binding transcription regulator [Schleiferilactobacillus perolens]KRL14521.1 HTH-type transcriptional regulator FruR [Schleiferilactobacillus perolens DSM 12744]
MIPYERQEKILAILADHDLVKIDELQSQLPDVSASTLRRDIKTLESENKIEHLIGGAIKVASATGEVPIVQKIAINSGAKRAIAERAAKEIHEQDSIYVDSGSNCTFLLNQLLGRQVTIYTTNTAVLSITGAIEADIILLGGQYNPAISSLSGALTESNLRSLYFDKAFLGVNGVDEIKGVTTPTISEATKKRLVKENSRKTYLLCDSSKFHRFSTVKAFDLKDVVLVSDKQDAKLGKQVPLLVAH